MEFPKFIKDLSNDEFYDFAWAQIKEAEALGLKFCGYAHVQVTDGIGFIEGGVHLFLWDWPAGRESTAVDNKEAEKLEAFLTKDDDSQPHATYTDYFGEIWQMVPYSC